MTYSRIAFLVTCILSSACNFPASMPKLKHAAQAERRNTCQAYVDDSAAFVGQQQGLGVASVAIAATSVTAGAALTNAESGNEWDKNRKTILLTAAVPIAILAYNFLSNASSASTSAATASLALAEKDDDAMWVGCEKARATYWDGRTAGIAAASASLNKSLGTPTTPQGRLDATSQSAADAAVDRATKAIADAKTAFDEATKTKPPPAEPQAAYADAKKALESAQKAERNANTAVIALKAAIAVGDNATATAKLGEAMQAGEDATKETGVVQAKLKEYLKPINP
ncbi:MAG TPA: hypothetical protein VIV60_14840 [Polyangiaceae bacterium]